MFKYKISELQKHTLAKFVRELYPTITITIILPNVRQDFKRIGEETREASCLHNKTTLPTHPSTSRSNKASTSNAENQLIKCFQCFGFRHIASNCLNRRVCLL